MKKGDAIDQTGSREERNGVQVVAVTIGTTRDWSPFDAIDPATLPPAGEIEYVHIPE